MPSIGTLLHKLKQGDTQAVVLEDNATHLADWLSMLQMRAGHHVPVIVVGDGQGVGMAEALAYGATDYAEHNGSVCQLLARLRARVGLAPVHSNQRVDIGPFSLDPATSAVFHEGVEVSLTSREFSLAWVLFTNVGRVVGMSSLAARVWGRSSEVCKRTLEQHIYRLRRKLSVNDMDSRIRIQTVYSVGYRLDLRKENRPDWSMSDFGVDAAAAADALFASRMAPSVAPPPPPKAVPILPGHLW
ncbi:MAG TPA: response regulator transcription factor [Burkholderiaceae bacterium]|nr:response regulator transcription factor [Burkholderiaceae bacterium]